MHDGTTSHTACNVLPSTMSRVACLLHFRNHSVRTTIRLQACRVAFKVLLVLAPTYDTVYSLQLQYIALPLTWTELFLTQRKEPLRPTICSHQYVPSPHMFTFALVCVCACVFVLV